MRRVSGVACGFQAPWPRCLQAIGCRCRGKAVVRRKCEPAGECKAKRTFSLEDNASTELQIILCFDDSGDLSHNWQRQVQCTIARRTMSLREPVERLRKPLAIATKIHFINLRVRPPLWSCRCFSAGTFGQKRQESECARTALTFDLQGAVVAPNSLQRGCLQVTPRGG